MEKKSYYSVGLSKKLSLVLRHSAIKMGLHITPEGYAKIEDVIKLPVFEKFKPTMEMIMEVVNSNEKKRFEVSADKLYIRALQGHTMKV